MDRLTSDELQMLIDDFPPFNDATRLKQIEPIMVIQDLEQLKSNYPETKEETKLKIGELSGESK